MAPPYRIDPDMVRVARTRAREALHRRQIRSPASPTPYTALNDSFSIAAHQDSLLPEKNNNPYPRAHPMNNQNNHLALLQHISDRCLYGKSMMDQRAERFSHIDRQLVGFLKLDEDDRRRDVRNKRGRGVLPTDVNLTLTLTQLDEAMTYLLSVFAPESGIFEAVADPSVQHVANAFAKRMNKDSDRFQYYRHLNKGFFNMLKYNLGGWLIEWKEQRGIVFERDELNPAAQPNRRTDVVWRGNRVESVDCYNLLWDPTVHPVDLADKGEYFAIIDIYRKFDILRMWQNEEIFDVWKFVNFGQFQPRYYRAKPDVRIEATGSGSVTGTGNQDWFKIMSGGVLGDVSKGFELINYYGWVIPKKFGLSDSKDYEVWRITVANNSIICRTDPIDSSHGMLPIALASPIEDDLGMQQKSYGEQLLPLQTFGSSLINAHQRSNRKALYGTLFYNANVIPLKDKDHGDLESAKIPVNPPGYGEFDIRKHIFQVNDAPKTDNTLPDLEKLLQIMQKILPTDMLKQVAELQRATAYQAAATVQSGNRRNLKMARLIEDQAVKKVRFQCMYNYYDKLAETLSGIDPQTGQPMQINPADVATAGIEFAMAEGLKGIDKIYIIEVYKELLGMMLQSQSAMQQFDFVGFFNFIGSLMGDKTDLAQFRLQDPIQMLDPQDRQLLTQVIQSGQLRPLLQAYVNQLRGHGGNAAENVTPLRNPPGQPGQAQSTLGQPGAARPSFGGDD